MIGNTIYPSPVTPSEVISIMGSCKDSSPGFDDIKISPLRCIFQHIANPLSYICNLSLTHGVFPETLKTANVIPLFKKDNQMFFNNYRPVSLLCTFSKILEKVMYERLLDFLNEHKTLFQCQFGFKKKKSFHPISPNSINDKLKIYWKCWSCHWSFSWFFESIRYRGSFDSFR